MKGFSVYLELGADIVGVAAMGELAACAIYLDLSTSICRKEIKVNAAKGIQTPSQVVIGECQSLCN
jgi:hypothetical protein